MEQYELLDAKFISHTKVKKQFSVSMQHYTFAVDAFAKLVQKYGMDEYEFEVHETKTYDWYGSNLPYDGIICGNYIGRHAGMAE